EAIAHAIGELRLRIGRGRETVPLAAGGQRGQGQREHGCGDGHHAGRPARRPSRHSVPRQAIGAPGESIVPALDHSSYRTSVNASPTGPWTWVTATARSPDTSRRSSSVSRQRRVGLASRGGKVPASWPFTKTSALWP